MDDMDFEEGEIIQEQKLVHLDLKGAPPKLSYLEQIFPLLRRWGATGLLVEYEDMFPFSGHLADLASPNAYSAKDIRRLQELAKSNGLLIIPLVQTFGHFEFVLKHEKFREMREVPPYPMTLCPLHENAVSLVTTMIDQVIELHPSITWFHIGADEVFHLGLCQKCRTHLETTSQNNAQLFFSFIKKVLIYMKERYPKIQPIMWDDMFREVDLDIITESGIGELVEPMVWYYQRTFHLPADVWQRYSRAFTTVWVASAFKGATGPCMFATDISYHVENHKGWLKVVKEEIRPKFQCFRGYAVTGWQRYDHYSVLCELLPVGLPSLAICLSILHEGAFTEHGHKQASNDMGFTSPMALNPFKNVGVIPECNFPGSEIYRGALILFSLKGEYKKFLHDDRLNGWMTDYHVKRNFTNPAHLKHFLPQAGSLLLSYQQLESELKEHLIRVFFADAVDEWLACNIAPRRDKLIQITNDATAQLPLAAQPKQYPEGFPKE